MGLKRYKPTTSGRRLGSVSDFAEITSVTPEKRLLLPMNKKGGRNNEGKITVRHRGGGSRRKYRIIDFKRVGETTRVRLQSGIEVAGVEGNIELSTLKETSMESRLRLLQ